MIEAGLVDEVRSLLAEPAGISDQAAQALGYAEIIAYLRGLGISAVELLPVQPVAMSRALWQNGLTD